MKNVTLDQGQTEEEFIGGVSPYSEILDFQFVNHGITISYK